MSELKKRFSFRALNQFYRQHRSRFKKSPSAGVDRVKFAEFDRNSNSILRRLAADVVAGRFRFRKLRPFPLEKVGGGVRWLCIPTIEDRLVQRVLVDALINQYKDKLSTKYSFGSISRADVEGESDATKLACTLRGEYRWCVKADVSKFFDRISRPDLLAKVRAFVRHRSLHPLLEMVISNEIDTTDVRIEEEIKASEIMTGRGVRQGMPLSPLLAHLYLVGFDRWTDQSDILCIRYVDDLLILAKSKEQVLEDFGRVRDRLASDLLLQVHPLGGPGKTQLIQPSQPVEFLGVEIRSREGSYERRIPGAAFARLEARVVERLDVRPENFQPNHIPRSVAFISNLGGAYEAAYGDLANWPQFRSALEGKQRQAIHLFRKRVGAITKVDGQILAAFGIKRRQAKETVASTSPQPA